MARARRAQAAGKAPRSRYGNVNRIIARVFDDIADLLEIDGGNPFRIRAYRRAARELRGSLRDVGEIMAHGEDLTGLPGIGRELAGRMREIIATGHCETLDTLHARLPASLHEVLRIPGLGPKRVAILVAELGVASVDDVVLAARQQRIQELVGFGPRIEQRILAAALERARTSRSPTPWAAAATSAQAVLAALQTAPGVVSSALAGAGRRQCVAVEGLEFVVAASTRGGVIDAFTGFEAVARVLEVDGPHAAVMLRNGLRADLWVVDPDAFGAALHHFTGSRAHIVALQRMALAQGLRIDDQGVHRGERRVAGDTEASLFEAVGLPWIPPELREGRGEIEAARDDRLPRLIEATDLAGDFVVLAHRDPGAVASAGAIAVQRGLSYLVVLHGAVDRRGLAEARATVGGFPPPAGLAVLEGVEVDLRDEPPLTPADVAPWARLLVGRVCVGSAADRGSNLDAVLAALDRWQPDGVRIRMAGADPFDAEHFDVDRLLEALHERGAFLCVDAEPADLRAVEPLLRRVDAQALPLAITSGIATTRPAADRLDLAVGQARRAWVEGARVVNAQPLERLPLRGLPANG